MEKQKLRTGLTVWLWIVFVLNIITAVVLIPTIIASLALFGIGITLLTVLSLVAEIVLIVGVAMMLFPHKKQGFTIVVIAAVISLIISILTDALTGSLGIGGIIKTLLSACVGPLIIYLLAKKDMEEGVLN